MKVVWKRNYNIKGRLYIEGLYLNNAGFKAGKSITYKLDKRNKSAIIKTTDNSNNKVTHNISRSNKVVPTIGVRNKSIEQFMESIDNIRLYVFNGIIVLLCEDTKNKNLALCEALIVHNKNIKSAIKELLKKLIAIGVLDDNILLEEINLENREDIDRRKRGSVLPRKIIDGLRKQTYRLLVKEKFNFNSLTNKSSNSFILGSILKEHSSSDEEEADSLTDFLINNIELLTISEHTASSALIHREKLYVSYKSNSACKRKQKDNLANLLNPIIDKVTYGQVCTVREKAITYKFLEYRKQINTLSPPQVPNLV